MPDAPGRVVWSLTASGLGTTITAAGNSGGYTAASPTVLNAPNARTPVDLRYVDDIWLSCIATGAVTGTTPSLVVSLGMFDDLGNLFPTLLAVPAVTTAGSAGAKVAFAGKHGTGGGASAYLVPSEWGQVAWTVSGTTPSFSGVEITLYGR